MRYHARPMDEALIPWLILLALGYLAGSIPFALLLGKVHGVDIRQSGSGNVGATNLGRTVGRKWGILCFLLDAAKGALPVLVAGWWMGMFWAFALPGDAAGAPVAESIAAAEVPAWFAWGWLCVAAAAMLGHIFPIWLKFKGGKGVATGFGAMLGFWPIVTLPIALCVIVWLTTLALTRYVGLASVLAALALPATLAIGGPLVGLDLPTLIPFLCVTSLLALLVTYRHRGNLARTFAGTEHKVGQIKTGKDSSAAEAAANE